MSRAYVFHGIVPCVAHFGFQLLIDHS